MFRKLKDNLMESRKIEEALYEKVLRELEQGSRRDGLWAKAYSQADGDEKKAKSLYIKLRVQSLTDEFHVEQRRYEDTIKRYNESLKRNQRMQSELNRSDAENASQRDSRDPIEGVTISTKAMDKFVFLLLAILVLLPLLLFAFVQVA